MEMICRYSVESLKGRCELSITEVSNQNLLTDDHVHSLRRINAAPSKLSVASIPVKPGIDESSSETVSLDLVESSGKASSTS